MLGFVIERMVTDGEHSVNLEHPQPNPSAASVVVFEHPVVSRDCADALQRLGFSVTYLPLNESNVMGLMTTRPDYVFTINFNRYISEVCELLKVPYLSWVIDTPCYPIYDKAIDNPHSYTFIYDAAVALKLRNSGIRQVYHLPVAANVDRINPVRVLAGDALPPTDISFVANLTRTEYRTLILPKLGELGRTQCSHLIDSLDHPGGFAQLPEQIDAQLIQSIIEESGYPLAGDLHLTTADKLAYILGREHSWQERIAFVRLLEEHFAVSVYGNAEWRDHITGYRGEADHFTLMPEVFRQSKINLNLTRSFVEEGLPMRVFDVLSCGGFLLTNDKPDLHRLFTDGKDLVIFRDTQDLLEICRYYLEHDDERQAIARQGQATLTEHHTVEQRMIDLFTTVQGELSGQPSPLSRWCL